MGRKKGKKRNAADISDAITSQRSASMRFAEDLAGAQMQPVNPKDCVPLVVDRDRYEGGVQKLKRIFTGMQSDGTTMGTSNVSAGSGAPLVVVITDTYRPYLGKALLEMGYTPEEVRVEMDKDKVWYGVVDGNFSLWALLELMEEEPSIWSSFKWTVLVLSKSPSMERLRQIKRTGEETRKAANCIEVTLYDEYQRMYNEFTRLSKGRQKQASSTAVAMAYDGNDHKSTDSVSQKARTAIRLGPEVIRELGEIINAEHPELAVADLPDRHPAKLDTSTANRYIDCRVFKSFVSDHALKQATNFINRQGEDTHHVQVHVLYRLRTIFRENGYKSPSYKVVVDQYAKCRAAMQQCRAFEAFIGSTTWPDMLDVFKSKMTRGTSLDAEIATVQGNGLQIIPSLMNEFKALYPDDFARCEKKTTEMDDDEEQVQDHSEPQLPADTTTDDGQLLEASLAAEEISAPATGDAPQETDRKDAASTSTPEEIDESSRLAQKMESIGIHSYNTTWPRYCSTIRKDNEELFDCVITDPPYGTPKNPSKAGSNFHDEISTSEFTDYGEALFSLLRRGGFVFIFSSAHYIEPWKKSLRSAGFEVWKGVYVLTKSITGHQMRRRGSFPQHFSEFGVIAYKPGERTDGFRPDFKSPYEWVKCRYPRRLAVIDEVPMPRPKLLDPETKLHMRVEEKSDLLLMELLKIFCPAGGSVFDGYGGTLSMAMAALKTGRRAVVVEKDGHCFKVAMERLHTTFKDIYKDTWDFTVRTTSRVSEEELRPQVLDLARRVDSQSQTTNRNTDSDLCTDSEHEGRPSGEVDAGTFASLEDINSTMKGPSKEPDSNIGGTHSEAASQARSGNIGQHPHSIDTVPGLTQSADTSVLSNGEQSGRVGHSRGQPGLTESVSTLAKLVLQSGHMEVQLMRQSVVIGTASLDTEMDPDTETATMLRRTIHGHNLDKKGSPYDACVVVRRCAFATRYLKTAFDCPHVGSDDAPESLQDLRPFGFYLWPAADIRVAPRQNE